MYTLVQGQREKLDNIYICTECNMVFLFKSDVDDHQALIHREKMSEIYRRELSSGSEDLAR